MRILGIGKVGGVLVTGEEAGSNGNLARQMSCGGLGGSALGSALSWLHEPGRGAREGCRGYGEQDTGEPKPGTELLWRMSQDSVLRR